jgi:HCOMODA/2-hydroxy-3-carboxy-muconic semialdehyde decarboxylase
VNTQAHQTGNVVVQAGRVLSGLGLVTAFGHVSHRAEASMLITPAADLAGVQEADLIEVSLDAGTLPPGAPAEAWAHLAVYAARPDTAAIARAQPAAAFAAAAALSGAALSRAGLSRAAQSRAALSGGALPGSALSGGVLPRGAALPARPDGRMSGADGLPLLYGQACWLGERVPVHRDARLLRSAALAQAAVATLGASDALLLRGNGALTCAATPGLAVARMWLLAAACRAWLDAAAAGPVAVLSQAEVESWRAVQSELLPRLWEHLSASVTIPRTRSSSRQGTARG